MNNVHYQDVEWHHHRLGILLLDHNPGQDTKLGGDVAMPHSCRGLT